MEGSSTENWVLRALRRSTAPRESSPASISGWSGGTCSASKLRNNFFKTGNVAWDRYHATQASALRVGNCNTPAHYGTYAVCSQFKSGIFTAQLVYTVSKLTQQLSGVSAKRAGWLKKEVHLCAHDGACSSGHSFLDGKQVRNRCSGPCFWCSSPPFVAVRRCLSHWGLGHSSWRQCAHELHQDGGWLLCRQ